MKGYIAIATLIVIIAGMGASWFKISRLKAENQKLRAKNFQLNDDLTRLTGKLAQQREAVKKAKKAKENCLKAIEYKEKDISALKQICDEVGIARDRLNKALEKERGKECKCDVCPEFPELKKENENINKGWNKDV